MVMVRYGHQGEEAVIYVAYFEIICAMGVERRDKGSALFEPRREETGNLPMRKQRRRSASQ